MIGAVHSLAEPGDPHQSRELPTFGVSDQKAGRVGATVDGRHGTGAGAGVDRVSGHRIGLSHDLAGRCRRAAFPNEVRERRKPFSHPVTHRIGIIHQPPSEVRVETLDALASPAHPAGRSRAAPFRRDQGIACLPVAVVRCSNRLGVHHGPGLLDTALGLQSGDGPTELGVDQPVTGRHRRAIFEEGGVLNDDRLPVRPAHHDREVAFGCATEKSADLLEIHRVGGQRQNSRACSIRSNVLGCDDELPVCPLAP
jgi:hypothetical protein